jgi:hypothetical protein
MIDIVTKLDPYFYPAYEFGGIMIPQYTPRPDAAIIILNRGILRLGKRQSYKLPFYLGWLYYTNYGDCDMASHYLALASHYPSAPPFLPALAASLYVRAGKKESAQAFLAAAYQAAENPMVKRSIAEKILRMAK